MAGSGLCCLQTTLTVFCHGIISDRCLQCLSSCGTVLATWTPFNKCPWWGDICADLASWLLSHQSGLACDRNGKKCFCTSLPVLQIASANDVHGLQRSYLLYMLKNSCNWNSLHVKPSPNSRACHELPICDTQWILFIGLWSDFVS